MRTREAGLQLWTLMLRREPTNSVDNHAVAVMKDDALVGHVPYNLAPRFSQFLIRNVNKVFAEVAGKEVNRGADYGQEVPCIFRLYGPKRYILSVIGGYFVWGITARGMTFVRYLEVRGVHYTEVRNVWSACGCR